MSSETRPRAVLDDVAEKFPRDVAEHEVAVLHESGLYRHVRFKQPKNSHYWFDLITWPGSLVINGDMSTYALSRIDDMFEFFRGPNINATYWAEKLRATSGTERYSEDKFRAHITEAVAERADEFPDLAAAVDEDILDAWSGCDYSTEDTARLAVRDFQYWLKPENKYKPGARPDFQFEDTYEWNLTDWDYHFIWCLHAIRWGIEKYDAERAASVAAEVPKPEPKRLTPADLTISPYGRAACPSCGRDISLTKKDVVRVHGREKDLGKRFTNCPGSGKAPAASGAPEGKQP